MLLIGINPAPRSVAAGHYYQGTLGQRLWERLESVGLLDRSTAVWEDDAFVAAGNGLTDLVKRPTASASELSRDELASGKLALADKVQRWRPGLLLFAFKPPAQALLGRAVPTGVGPSFAGIQTFRLEGPYVASAYVDANLRELAALVGCQ